MHTATTHTIHVLRSHALLVPFFFSGGWQRACVSHDVMLVCVCVCVPCISAMPWHPQPLFCLCGCGAVCARHGAGLGWNNGWGRGSWREDGAAWEPRPWNSWQSYGKQGGKSYGKHGGKDKGGDKGYTDGKGFARSDGKGVSPGTALGVVRRSLEVRETLDRLSYNMRAADEPMQPPQGLMPTPSAYASQATHAPAQEYPGGQMTWGAGPGSTPQPGAYVHQEASAAGSLGMARGGAATSAMTSAVRQWGDSPRMPASGAGAGDASCRATN